MSLNKERTKENQPRRSPWEPPALPLYKKNQERSHKSFQCSASTLTNTSGRHRKQNVLPKQTHLGRALMRPRWRRLAKVKAPAALKKPSGGGVPRGVPLVPFLATSWGMPRSSINLPAARCAADKREKTKFQTASPFDAHTAARCAVPPGMPFLCRSTKKWRKKGNEGFAPRPRAAKPRNGSRLRWKPSVSKAALKGIV